MTSGMEETKVEEVSMGEEIHTLDIDLIGSLIP